MFTAVRSLARVLCGARLAVVKVLSALFFSVSTVLPVNAQISYPDFSDTSGLTLYYDATVVSDNAIRLNPAQVATRGAFFTNSRIDITQGFSSTFEFFISEPGGILDRNGLAGGDGIFLNFRNSIPENPPAIGGDFYVFFDTWANVDFGDISSNQVHIVRPGNVSNVTPLSISLDDGERHTARVDYDANINLVSVLLDGVEVANLNVNLSDFQPVYAGLGSYSGDAFENHLVYNFSLTASAAAPEPGTVALIAAGVPFAALVLRRRKA